MPTIPVSHDAVLKFIVEELRCDPEEVTQIHFFPDKVEVVQFRRDDEGHIRINQEGDAVLTRSHVQPIKAVEGLDDNPF